MRKALLATTAIAGSAALAGGAAAQTPPITVTLGGFLDTQANYTNEKRMGKSDNARRKIGLHTSTELLIVATGKAANGLTYGAYIEMEADTTGSTNADETNAFLQGAWGRMELGNQDAFAFSTTGLRAGATDLGGGGVAGDAPDRYTVAPTGGSAGGSFNTTSIRGLLSGDAGKITYASPTFSGFQAGISYAPTGSDSSFNSTGEVARSSITTVVASGTSASAAAANTEDYVEVGAQWSGTFSGVSVRFGGAFTMADAKTPAAGASTFEDYQSWSIGTRIGFMGFSVGAQYANQGDSGLSKVGRVSGGDSSGRAWTAGVAYVTGPFGVHISYSDSRHEGAVGVAGDDTRKWISAGANYIYAPGARVGLELSRNKDKDEGGGTPTSENKATVLQLIHAIVF